ncbi:MAG TPA: hypothetical protein VK656_03880 [Candidatus Acidoferrum sp.]|nr:hypothetical protein [Candidatus Acidoferrum sp.]
MRIDHRLLGWGLFFITLGAVPLAVRGNLVDSGTVLQAWRFWPLVLVAIGVGVILRETRIAAVGSLVVALTFGLLGGGVLAGGSFDLGAIACGSSQASGPTVDRQGTFAATASVALEARCADLNVHGIGGSGWTFSGLADAAHQPEITVASDNLRVASGGDRTFFPGFGGPRERWDIGLPQASNLDLAATVDAGDAVIVLSAGTFSSIDVTINAASARLDLGGAQVAAMGVTVNAGDARIVLPDSSMTGDFTVNAGSIRLCTAADAGIRIDTRENVTGSYDFGDAGLVKDGSTWVSPNFGTTRASIDISATANVASISLNPKDGCT